MASNFFDKASLVMVPDAPFDGTLPSVKPFDRSGDFTFSRGSNLAATRVGPDGNIEKGRENIILQSNQFDTTWVQYQGGTVTSGQSDKDGGEKAWKLNVVDNQSFSGLYQSISGSGVCTMSLFAKAGTLDHLGIVNMSGSGFAAWFDLSSGTIGTQNSSNIDAKIEAVGSDGWYRLSITQNLTSADFFQLKPSDGENTPSGEDGYIYIMNAQTEYGLVATDYLETKTTTKKAGVLEDEPRIDFTDKTDPSLLLEPQRTNLIPQSERFDLNSKSNATIETNSAKSPEGVKNASTFKSNGGGTSYIQFTSSTPSSDKVISIFAKENDHSIIQILNTGDAHLYANFNLSNGSVGTSGSGTTATIENYGNGWYRCVCVWDSAETINQSDRVYFMDTDSRGYAHGLTLASGVGVYLWGAQVENNVSYPTSYIPTYGSSVTRSLDVCDLDGMNAAGVSTSNNWTYFIDVDDIEAGTNGFYLYSTSGEILHLYSTSIGYRNTSNSTTYVSSWGWSSYNGNNSQVKMIFRYDGDKLVVFINGVKKDEVDSSLVSARFADPFNRDRFHWAGKSKWDTNQKLFFNTALTDSECIALTTI